MRIFKGSNTFERSINTELSENSSGINWNT